MGTNTDPYQHAEGKYHLTRGIVETLSGARNPFSILTKSTLILRDAAVLAAACERTEVGVSFSIGTLDRSVWKLTEPGTPPPDRRVEALRRLTAMGIPCGVLVAPVLPGLSDSEAQLTEVVEACADAGAVSDLRRGPAPARPDARALLRLAPGRAARPGPPPPGALPARRLPGGRGAPADRGHREGGGTALRRDGRNRYRGRRSPVDAGGRDRAPEAAATAADEATSAGEAGSNCACSEGRVDAGSGAPYDRGLMPGGSSIVRASRRGALGLAALLAASVLVALPAAAPGNSIGVRRSRRPARPTAPTPSSTRPAAS